MIDYYPFLLRAVQGADSADEQARRDVYTRAWQIVTDELRARRPPVSVDELRAHRDAIQSAIERIEHQYSNVPAHGHEAPSPSPPAIDIAGDIALHDDARAPSSRRALWVLAAAAVVGSVLAAGGYFSWTSLPEKKSVPVVAAKVEEASQEPRLRRRHTVVATTNELAPGVDGGSTDADLPLIFRRQRVFYRTTLAPGTIVIDQSQHFAYLVLPNSAALRYGIGVGASCAELTGLRRIARKEEWPQWTPPPGSNLNKGEPMQGRPGNPLGSRLLDLDDNVSRIHGTNAPKTIGEDVALGCLRLVNDDIADLYVRISLGTAVVMR